MIHWLKQPDEKIPKTLDFTNALPSAETVASCATSAVNEAGEDKTSDLITDQIVATPNVTVTLKTCVAGNYKITFKVTTSSGFIIEEDVLLKVIEALTVAELAEA